LLSKTEIKHAFQSSLATIRNKCSSRNGIRISLHPQILFILDPLLVCIAQNPVDLRPWMDASAVRTSLLDL